MDIYPPDLAEEGLPVPSAELADRLRAKRHPRRSAMSTSRRRDAAGDRGGAVPVGAGDPAQRRITQSAQHVELTVTVESAQATMVVDDDGRGFDEEGLAQRVAEGHVGLRGLSDLVADAGGS